MAKVTGISWCDSTFNPFIGCTKVSPGCDNCYAEAMDKRHRYGGAVHWGAGVPRYRTSASYWRQPLKWNAEAEKSGKRHLVFCASLADVFDNEVPEVWRGDLWRLIRATPALTWLLLTKRIGNAAKMMDGLQELPNVWLGASVVNQQEADRDIQKLLATPSAKHFLSLEPMLGPINLDEFHPFRAHRYCDDVLKVAKGILAGHVDWVIVGGESAQGGAKARPFAVEWARSTVRQCKAAGVACFVKQLGSDPGLLDPSSGPSIIRFQTKDRAGADPAEWPEALRVQEFPDTEPQGGAVSEQERSGTT